MTHTCEVWILVDQGGDYGVGTDAESAADAYGNDVAGDLAGSRLVKLLVEVALPDPIQAKIIVPPVQGECTITAE